jgi:O-antigen/teichoic acid export membrane protein
MPAGPTRRFSFGGAVVALTLVRIGSVGAGFITSVVGAQLIGAAGLGIVGAATTVATIGALVSNGGLNIATVYYLGQRPDDAGRIVGWIATLGLLAAALAAGIALLAGGALGEGFLGSATPPILAASALLAAGILGFELAGGILLGLQERGAYIAAQVLEAIGSLVLTVIVLVLISTTAAGYLVAAAAGYWLGIGLAIWRARRRLPGTRLAFSRTFTGQALAMGLRGQVGNILQFLNLRLDLLLVPALLNLASAGVYLIAIRVSEVVTQVASSAATFLFAHVAAQADRRATWVTERTVRLSLLFVLVSGLPLALLAEPILAIFFGPDFVAGSTAVRITLIAMLPLSVVRILAGDLKGRGRPGLVSIAALLALGVTVVGDLTLIPPFGIAGAALASLASYTLSAALLIVAYRRVTGAPIGGFLPRTSDVVAAAAMVRSRRPAVHR